MPIFAVNKQILTPISEIEFDLERDIQKLTEANLQTIFGLTFISGALNQEFSIPTQDQEFYIDTLAFDEASRAFVIIEYKKDKSFSIIDQGFAYLSAMLNHKANFVLELNERLQKSYRIGDIDWEQSRVIFISPSFTNYQKNAINFKDLPIFLYEVHLYSNNIIEYDSIKPYKTTQSIQSLTKDKIIREVSKEVKVYSVDDLIKPEWTNTKSLLEEFEKQLLSSESETKVKYTKFYIAYMSKHGRNYVEIVPQKQGLKVYYRFPAGQVKSELKIGDCSKIGHWTNGESFIYLNNASQIPEALRLTKESFAYLHKDIYGKKKQRI